MAYDINADPGVIGARAAYNQGVTSLDSWLRNLRTSSFVNFGDPNMAIPGFNLDPNVAEMARQNYATGNATLARLDQSHTNAVRAIVNQLAARGILSSGDLGYRQGQENQLYGNNVYDARQALLSTLDQAQQSYLDRKSALESGITNALQNAYANAASFDYGASYGGTGGGTAPAYSAGYNPGIAARISARTRPAPSRLPSGAFSWRAIGQPYYIGQGTARRPHAPSVTYVTTSPIYGSGTQVGHA